MSSTEKILRFGIPKGSLEQQTLELMRKSGWRISVDSRSHIPTVDDAALQALRVMRPQEMPRYIADGHLDAAITGSDWVMENAVDLVQVESFIYSGRCRAAALTIRYYWWCRKRLRSGGWKTSTASASRPKWWVSPSAFSPNVKLK